MYNSKDMENNLVGPNAIKKNQNKMSYITIFIGNIASEASWGLIRKFLDDINIISLKLLNGKKQNFAFANLPNLLEAKKAIEMYNNKDFMGHKLVLRFGDKQKEVLPEMPKLEDIDDEEATSQCDSLSNQSSNSKTKMTCTNNKQGQVKIYIGNIDVEASKIDILKLFEGIQIISIKLFQKKNKTFAFAIVPNMLEAEKALDMYNTKMFMGHKLVLRLADNSSNEKSRIISEMPRLEDNEDDNESASVFDSHDDSSIRSGTSQTISVDMPQLKKNQVKKNGFCGNNKNCFEDSINIQPDPNGLFSLHIHRKGSYLRSKNVIENIFSQYGSVSSVSFVDNAIVVKMPLKQQAINSFKALGQELNITIGHNSCDTNTIKSDHNKSHVEIYIGNIAAQASKARILKFFDVIQIISFKLISKKNKVFAFAIVPNMLEAEKALDMYNTKMFMGHKLVLRLADNSSNEKSPVLPEMPTLEDIEDNENASVFDSHDDLSSQSCTSQTMSVDMSQLKKNQVKKNGFCRNINNSSNTFSKSPCNNSNSSDKTSDNSSQDDYTSKDSDQSKRFLQDQVTLFVGNFPIGMSEEQLLSLFHDFHPSSVNIINNQNPKRSTQALMNFPNPRESEKAICKFDKSTYKCSTLLVTSVGFCPSFDNQKAERINKARSPPVHFPNGSRSLDKKLENMNMSSSVKPHQQHQKQQRRNNFEATNSSSHTSEAKMSLTKIPPRPNVLPEKKQHLEMEEGKYQQQYLEIDDLFKKEAAKMAILVKHFQIQPSLESTSDIFQVMITSVINDELFWGNTFSSLDSDLTGFMGLHNELQSAALSWPKYNLSKTEMKCVALYQGEWYRAWVISAVGKDAVNVFFLDYGNISQIDLKDVRCPDESIWKLPPKAKAFRIDSESKKLPPNVENHFFDITICKAGNTANGFISVVTLISH